jgi:hypothetical protein
MKLRRDKLLPKSEKFSTDRALPHLCTLYREKADPKRMMPRTETEEPT